MLSGGGTARPAARRLVQVSHYWNRAARARANLSDDLDNRRAARQRRLRSFSFSTRSMDASVTAATTPRAYNPIAGASCVAPTYAADLDILPGHVAAVIEDARSLVAGLSDAQFNWKPSPGQWSIAQCLRHLVLTGTFAANGQDAAIAGLRARGRRSDGPYVYRGIPAMMGGLIMKGVEPPVQKKYKTGRKVVPAERHDRDALLAEFTAIHERLATLIVAAKGLDLTAASVPLPIPMFSMRLGQSLPFEIAHARRHLWQARQIRSSPQFPA